MKFRKWYGQFYADGVSTEWTSWPPPAPPGGKQPVYVRPDATASRKNRTSANDPA
jgi:hypothetical protein